jgi:hypothetical protein
MHRARPDHESSECARNLPVAVGGHVDATAVAPRLRQDGRLRCARRRPARNATRRTVHGLVSARRIRRPEVGHFLSKRAAKDSIRRLGTTWEQRRPNTRENRGVGPTRKQDESTRLTSRPCLQNLHPRFESGRRSNHKPNERWHLRETTDPRLQASSVQNSPCR